jgi:hypothetical protein
MEAAEMIWSACWPFASPTSSETLISIHGDDELKQPQLWIERVTQ